MPLLSVMSVPRRRPPRAVAAAGLGLVCASLVAFAPPMFWPGPAAQVATATAPRFAVFVVDGLRPDSITAATTPTLARLRAIGAEIRRSHSVFPTVTRLNTATLATGTYPSRHGIVGNSMFVASVNSVAPFDTGDYRTLLALESAEGRPVTTDTLGEVLQRHGRTLVTVSSGSTGNGFLLNPEARHGAGVVIHGLFDRGSIAGYPASVSDAILRRFGAPPPDPDDLGQMRWTDTVLREYVLPELRPDVVIDWLGPLDSAQHADGVSSPNAVAALREIDASIGRTLALLEAGGSGPTNIIVTSDHGFARATDAVDVVGALVAAGLKQDRASTDVVVASQSQSVLLYVKDREPSRVAALVRFLQGTRWADVIFTRGGRAGIGAVAGTFSLDLIQGAHPTRAPDVIVSLPWSSATNGYGATGGTTINSTAAGPLTGEAAGHGGLAPWVVRNTFLAVGPDVRAHGSLDTPASLADIAPTILRVLGLKADAPGSAGGRGRVLEELLTIRPARHARQRVLRVARGAYRAELTVASISGHDYVETGRRTR